VSPDQKLGFRRKRLLEAEGLPVVLIRRSQQLLPACREHHPRVIILGTSTTPAERRRIWAAARELCRATLVELTPHGSPEISQENYFVDPEPASDFVRRVKEILLTQRQQH
jgi:hypothetical protein